MTRQINAGEGSLGKLLKDDLNGATENIKTLTGKINSGEGTPGKLVTDRELFDQPTA